MHITSSEKRKSDLLKKAFLWLIVFDYLLLAFFLTQLSSMTLNSGTMISLLLVVYNVLLVSSMFSNEPTSRTLTLSTLFCPQRY